MSRVGTFMLAGIGSGLLVSVIALFISPRAASIAALILIPTCAAVLLLSRRSEVETPRVRRKQLWYRIAGFVMIMGSVVLLFIKNVRAANSGASIGAGQLVEFAFELGIGVFLILPISKLP